MCSYNHATKNINANNYQINVRKFDYKTPEDVPLWYTKVQDAIEQKYYEDVQTKFTLTKLDR